LCFVFAPYAARPRALARVATHWVKIYRQLVSCVTAGSNDSAAHVMRGRPLSIQIRSCAIPPAGHCPASRRTGFTPPASHLTIGYWMARTLCSLAYTYFGETTSWWSLQIAPAAGTTLPVSILCAKESRQGQSQRSVTCLGTGCLPALLSKQAPFALC